MIGKEKILSWIDEISSIKEVCKYDDIEIKNINSNNSTIEIHICKQLPINQLNSDVFKYENFAKLDSSTSDIYCNDNSNKIIVVFEVFFPWLYPYNKSPTFDINFSNVEEHIDQPLNIILNEFNNICNKFTMYNQNCMNECLKYLNENFKNIMV